MGVWATDAQGNRFKVSGLGLPGKDGKEGSVNGMPIVEIVAGENVEIETDPDKQTITISATGGGGGTTIVPIPEQSGVLTYNGQEQTPVWANCNMERCTVSGEVAATEAGTHTVTFSLNSPNDLWSDMTNAPKEIQWVINTAVVQLPTTSSALTYTGTAQVPIWDGFSAAALTRSGDLTGTDAGDYATKFTPTVNYTWPEGGQEARTVQWSIARAVVSVPEVVGNLAYTGQVQSPTFSGYDASKMTIGGKTSATDAGSYSTTFTVNSNHQWPDSTTSAKSVAWSIAKVAGSITLDKTSLSLTTAAPTGTFTVTRPGTGAISATSSDPKIADVSVDGNVVTVTGKETGNVTITIAVAADINHTAPADKTCTVSSTVVSNRIFGVVWTMNNSSPALARLTVANDPQKVVTTDITSEPVPAVGTGAGSSPFDNFYPWSKIDEWNVVNGVVTVKRGQSGFSRTANDVVVFIPEFYYKVVNDTTNNKRYYYISQKAATGFTKHPGSGRCVGKYNTGAGYVSKSGLAPLVSITRATARTGHKGRGAKFNNYDFASWCAIQLLYLVEFASWDSQSKVGRGYVDGNSAALNTGSCDAMTYHTGRPAGTDGKTGVMYRWIENPWGNVFDWVDGANFSERKAYICTNPDNFADDTATNYTDSGITLPSSGWIVGYGFSSALPWAIIPSTNGGSETTYACDYVNSSAGWRVLYVGGYWSNSGSAGLFFFVANYASSSAIANLGARQLYVPTAAEITTMAA